MSEFSKTITDHWHATFLAGDTIYRDEAFTVTVRPDLDEESRVMVMQYPDGRTMAVLTPALAESFGLAKRHSLSAAGFRQELSEAGLPLHGADQLFYFYRDGMNDLLQEPRDEGVRRLSEEDAALFATFQASASEQDLDDAYVELDHWAVFGVFAQGRLVGAASMYPWNETRLADLGVLTLEAFRGRGLARKVVRAICHHAYDQGYEPQYRCQLDNHASVALAKAAGLTPFGQWAPISPEATG